MARTIEQRRLAGQPFDRLQQEFTARLEQSAQILAARRAFTDLIEFPAQLPISDKRAEIARLIAANQVVVLAGETGSGKTTQLPKNLFNPGPWPARPNWSYPAAPLGGPRCGRNALPRSFNSPLGQFGLSGALLATKAHLAARLNL